MQARGILIALAGLALTAAAAVALMVVEGGILEPPYVERALRNAAEARAICDVSGPGPTPWIRGRLVIEPGADPPASLERSDGARTYVAWPRGFRVTDAGLLDEHGVVVAAPGTELAIGGDLVFGNGTPEARYLLTFTRLGSGCYVFFGKWPVVVGVPIQ
ncbi:MAG TPA: hypothetical protein VES19_02175 [Candidatus Limnocylindrales bacterium]|nr:hypothetical protein [Candidatus Limnocylindrales bacterium]